MLFRKGKKIDGYDQGYYSLSSIGLRIPYIVPIKYKYDIPINIKPEFSIDNIFNFPTYNNVFGGGGINPNNITVKNADILFSINDLNRNDFSFPNTNNSMGGGAHPGNTDNVDIGEISIRANINNSGLYPNIPEDDIK